MDLNSYVAGGMSNRDKTTLFRTMRTGSERAAFFLSLSGGPDRGMSPQEKATVIGMNLRLPLLQGMVKKLTRFS
jgi:hypothetical protein